MQEIQERTSVREALKNQLAAFGIDVEPRAETYNGHTFVVLARLPGFTDEEASVISKLIPDGVFAFFNLEWTCSLAKVKKALAL